MDVEAAFKKVFAKLDELGKRQDQIDPNGKLDEIKAEMQRVAADSRVVVSTMHAHGGAIHRLEKSIERLLLNCPAAAAQMAEQPQEISTAGNGSERVRPDSNEYERLAVAEKDGSKR